MDISLKNKLATTTALVVALCGYSRRAYSACVITSGSSYLCSGANAAALTITDNEATVSTDATPPGFSVNAASGNALTITGDGALSFTDTNASTITTAVAGVAGLYGGGGSALVIASAADDGLTPGSVTVNVNSHITGLYAGIATYNKGSGATTITVSGDVTATSGTGSNGIVAFNTGAASTDLSITAEKSSVITGGFGIDAVNAGIGVTTITANGDVTGTTETGIIGEAIVSSNLFITTGPDSVITGAVFGIEGFNEGTGTTTITANGDVAGVAGIVGISGADLSITTGRYSVITGSTAGIEAVNDGTGSVTITVNGDVTGTGAAIAGIYARGAAVTATDVTIITGRYSAITGGDYGINVSNIGTGAVTITNGGDVSSAMGILVTGGNGATAGGITNLSTGTIEGTGGTAISLVGLTAPLPITIDGGHIIGDVVDDTPANGFSPVTVAGNFTSQGNFDVSGFGVSSGATFTFGAGDTITSFNTVSDSGTMTVSAAGSSINGGLTVNSGGTLNAGASFGVTGALTNNGTVAIATGQILTAGSTSAGTGTLDFEVKAGSTTTNGTNGLLASSAAVDLTGSTLKVNVDPTSGYIRNDSRFEVITGVGAATTPVTTATTTPVLMASSDTPTRDFYYTTGAYAGSGYGGPIGGSDADVYVIAVQNNIATLPAITANDVSVYNALTTIAASSPSFGTLAGIIASAPTSAALHADLEALTPTVDGGAQVSALNVVAQTEDIANNRLLALRDGDTTRGVAAGATANGFSMWTEGYGQHASQDMMDGVNGYSANTWGGAVGFDSSALLDKAIVGLALNYGRSLVDSDNSNTTTTNLGNYGLIFYGTYDLGLGTFMNGQAGYGYNKITSDRHNANLAGATAEGNTNSDEYLAKLDLGHDYTVGSIDLADDWQTAPLTLTPDVSAAYTYLDTQGYTETGAGIADQIVGSNSQSTLDMGIGGTASWKIRDDNGDTVKPALHAGYSYDAVGDRIQTTSSFAGDPGVSFITDGASPARSTFDAGAKIIYATTANVDFSATYDFQIKRDYTANTGELRATAHF